MACNSHFKSKKQLVNYLLHAVQCFTVYVVYTFLRLLDHVCGTRSQFIYGCVTVSDSLRKQLLKTHLFGVLDRGAL